MAEPRPTTGGVLHPATEGILDAAADFLWSDEMAESLESFSTNHAEMFAGKESMDVEEGEHRLEWTTAHKDFQELFEFQLEQFVATQEFSTENFVAACVPPATCHASSLLLRRPSGTDSATASQPVAVGAMAVGSALDPLFRRPNRGLPKEDCQ